MKHRDSRDTKSQPRGAHDWMNGAYALDLSDADTQRYVMLLALAGLRMTMHAVPGYAHLVVAQTNGGVFGRAELQ